ncbi:MAG: sacsin N-terminal ATP-binding-like domain-containing protein [Prevotella sp.]
MSNILLKKLAERYTLNTNPDVATTVEQGLMQLSSGIYTEEERFIFELLQNAVDSYDEMTNDTLTIKIMIEGDYLVFMHNGASFSPRDIEGICDIGNGNKAKDTKKIGYKGIGFKSVFMRSTCVTIKTGEYCFMFDKQYWEGFWERNWKKEYGIKSDEKVYLMPWQIIPIEANEPISLDTSNYNVITYIKITNTSSLEKKIVKLLSNSQFLLFLRCKNIQMTFVSNNVFLANVNKKCNDNIVILSSNGKEDSRWLTYTNPEVEVPKELNSDIKADINTPQKLKNAKTFDLSFAIQIDNNSKIKSLDKDDAVIYTYLPTSFKFGNEGFPFLVNANFITDAGRQQLHKDSEWNKLIFSKIPSEYLNWMKEISSTFSNYYEVLPKKSYGSNNALEETFATEMVKAINDIAFIPRANNAKSKVLASSAVMDKMGMSEAISKKLLTTHINRTYNKDFSEKDFINPVWKGFKLLEDYGVFIFDKQKLKALFEDEKAFDNIEPCIDVKLIDFLFEYYLQNRSEQEELITVLQDTRFLLDEEGNLSCPHDLFFPSQYKERNELAEDAIFLHNIVNEHLESNKQEFNWVSQLGVEELSDITFIQNVICKSDYITKENSIEVTRFLFESNLNHNIFDEIDDCYLSRLQFLTKQGNLEYASDLYLGSKYKPEVDIEPYFDEDIFVSEDYCEDEDNISEWNLFLSKLGINNTLELRYIRLDETEDIKLLKDVKEKFGKEYNVGSWGTHFYYSFKYLYVFYAPFVLTNECSNDLLTIIWSNIFSKPFECNEDKVYGTAGFWQESRSFADLKEVNFIDWALDNYQLFPTTDGRCLHSNQILCNTDDIKDIADKYLPVINLNNPIHDSWNEVLHLRNILQLEDYLTILTGISKDEENVEQNKERISKIYQRLVDLDCLTSPAKTEQIKEWSKNNKILSKDLTFKFPKDLSHITLDGFSSENRVYIGSPSNREKVISLLSLMGVRVITERNIKPSFKAPKEASELKSMLKSIVSPLTIVALGEKIEETSYKEKKHSLLTLLNNTHFYHCEEIRLTYGNNEDTIEKNTFGNKNEFYYTGSLRPANIEPLLTSFCKYLDIKGKERELFIMLIENYEGIRQNLEDKGYDTSLLEEDKQQDSGTIQTTLGGYNPSISEQERNVKTGFKGEILVYEKLIAMGYTPICPSISTEKDYEQKISLNGKTYFCKSNYEKYDISFVTRNGVKVYLEVKATTRDKSSQENMPISYRELSMIEECDMDDSCSYMIVRVFGIDKEKQDYYILSGHLLKD